MAPSHRTVHGTTISSRAFNQNTSRAKKAANDGPVFITDRGKPAYVLLSAEAFERLSQRPRSAWEALAPSEPVAPDLDSYLPPRDDLMRDAFEEE